MKPIWVLLRKSDNRIMPTSNDLLESEEEKRVLAFYSQQHATEYHGNLPYKTAKDYSVVEYRISEMPKIDK
jgi:hypothetical protein